MLYILQSQLRNYLVSELRGKGYQKDKVTEKGDSHGLEKKVLESLIYKYLCDEGCDYTVGVFLPEAGITKKEVVI